MADQPLPGAPIGTARPVFLDFHGRQHVLNADGDHVDGVGFTSLTMLEVIAPQEVGFLSGVRRKIAASGAIFASVPVPLLAIEPKQESGIWTFSVLSRSLP